MPAFKEDISIEELARNVLKQSQEVTKYLEAHNLAAPTFSPKSSRWPNTPEFGELQNNLRSSADDLRLLIDGPAKFLHYLHTQVSFMGAFQIAVNFDFFTIVPAEGEISLDMLAEKAGMDTDRTSRIVRLLVAHRIFQEVKPNYISHNYLSATLLDEEERSLTMVGYNEMLQAAGEAGAGVKASPYQSDSTHCAVAQRYGVSVFEYYDKYPEKASRFAKAMAGQQKTDKNIDSLRNGFPWSQLEGTVVDVGGGNGHISMFLARHFPKLRFLVQDKYDHTLAQGQTLLTDDIRDRISFSKHDFMEPQPRTAAAAFILRQCAHDWSDQDVITMFKSVVPGLESSAPSTPFLINEILLPEPGTQARVRESDKRRMDIAMMMFNGGKERTVAEFETLLKEADPRYKISRVYDVGHMGLLEVYLKR